MLEGSSCHISEPSLAICLEAMFGLDHRLLVHAVQECSVEKVEQGRILDMHCGGLFHAQ